MLKAYHKKIINIILIIFIFVFSLAGCNKDEGNTAPEKSSKTAFLLNTTVSVTLYDGSDPSIIDDCLTLCEEYEKLLSRTIPTSEIALLNTREISSVSDDTLEVIQKGLYYSELSGGAFDITIGSLTSLWNFTTEDPVIPSADNIKNALKHIGYDKVHIEGSNITFDDEGLFFDLGAIAKGFIADKMKEYLIQRGVTSAIISLGGNVLLVGEKPVTEYFIVGIQYPYQMTNTTIATIKIKDMSIVSSGVYERYFVQDNKVYHHILNPETGYSYDSGLLSVTIISEQSADGDALSTICFALGLEGGMELINSLDGYYAVFIDEDFNVHFSDGLEDAFEINLTE